MKSNHIISIALVAVMSAAGVVLAQPDDPGVTEPRDPGPVDDGASPADAAPRPPAPPNRGRLGISVLAISQSLRAHQGAPIDRGVLVDAVRADSAAARAGVRVGDVITELDGAPARDAADLVAAMADRERGDHVPLVVIRDRKRIELDVTLTEDPAPFDAGARAAGGGFRIDPDFRRHWEALEAFDPLDLQRQLDDARRRLDQLERRLEDVERRRAPAAAPEAGDGT